MDAIKREVLVIAFATQLPREKGNNRSRFRYLCEYLAAAGHHVVEITSSFRDYDKTQRSVVSAERGSGYDIEILPEPGYEKNVSLNRIYSQMVFARNLSRHLAARKKAPSLVYCCVPTHEAALVAASYAKRMGVPFVIDVQDLWPEAMQLVMSNFFGASAALLPMKLMADAVYRSADAIVAVSSQYLARAVSVNRKSRANKVVYIGCDLPLFDSFADGSEGTQDRNSSQFVVTFLGMLGHSYDIATLIAACDLVYREAGRLGLRLKIIGDGELRAELENLAKNSMVPVEFTGWLEYAAVVKELRNSDLLVNAIKKDGPQSITNKISDYVSAGKCIINGSQNEEFMELMKNRRLGFNYDPENVNSMAAAIRQVMDLSRNEREEMGNNARSLAEERFNRSKTYAEIVEIVNNLALIG